VKSGLQKYIFEIPSCGRYLIFVTEFVVLGKNLYIYEVKKNDFLHGGVSKLFFLDHFSPSFLGQKL